jgi:hypothetical protein
VEDPSVDFGTVVVMTLEVKPVLVNVLGVGWPSGPVMVVVPVVVNGTSEVVVTVVRESEPIAAAAIPVGAVLNVLPPSRLKNRLDNLYENERNV